MLHRVALLKTHAKSSGGLEKYASRIAGGFASRGISVHVLTTEMHKDPPHAHITFHACSSKEPFERFVARWLKDHPVQLVFGMEKSPHQTHLRAGEGVHAAYLKSRLLSNGRGKYWSSLLNPKHRKILQREKEAFESPLLKKLFVNSSMVRREVLEHYAVDPTKIEVIYNGVEWKEMEGDFSVWQKRRIELCQKWQLDPHLFQFLFIGNGYRRKGLDPLLEALSQLPRRNFQLSVVGKEKRLGRYLAQAKRLKLQEHVRFFGPQKAVRPFYQLADSLLIPSFYDPFANVTLEALAMGLYVVSSRSNGGHEILSPENGVSIDDLLDQDALCTALERALNHPKTESRAAAIRQSAAPFDFSIQLGKLLDACG